MFLRWRCARIAAACAALVQARDGCAVACLLAQACLALTALLAAPVVAVSNVVQYTHDAAGNIVAIRRAGQAAITISGFAPGSGAMGTVVTISGTGFSPTAAGNRVTFNGVVAAVVTATASTVTVAVPPGASTGRIAVAVAGNTGTSTQDFVVTAPGAPIIEGFTPAAGPAGTAVTVTGANFDSATGATAVTLNGKSAPPSSVTTSTLAFAVPAATGSGRIRVTTGAGSAVSAGDFVVAPGAIAAGDIVAATRVVADGPARSIGIFATNKYGALLFDGSAGDWLSLQFGNFAINPADATIAYAVYQPDNTSLASGTLTATNLSIHLPRLAATGTYAVLLGSGIAQVSLDGRLETNRNIPSDGTTQPVERSSGQTARALIAAVAGEQKAVMVSELATVPAGTNFGYSVYLPSGSTFRNASATGLGTTSLLPPFTTTGTHAVVFAPTTSVTRTAFNVGLLDGIVLVPDAAALDFAIARPGEGARVNFAGTAGESLGIGLTGLVLNPASATHVSFTVHKPDASVLAAGRCYADGTECAANLANLPVTGNYSVIVQPANGATGSMRAWLSRDVTGTLIDGTPTVVALARPGQNARLTFAGTVGTSVAVQVRGVTTTPAGQGILVQIKNPDGSLLAYTHLIGTGQTLVTPTLAANGTYTVLLEPEPAARGAATATMEVLLDPGRKLGVDGATLTSTITVTGGSARFRFAATAGQNLGLGVGNLALSATADATVTVYRPDGTALFEIGCAANLGGCSGNLDNLPATGIYAIVVRPAAGTTGVVAVTLSTDLPGTLAVGSAALPINLDRPGRNARLTFAGTAGQTVRLGWSGVAIAGSNRNAGGYVNDPSGTTMGFVQLANGIAGGYDLPALPATGTYTIFIEPPFAATMNATLTVTAR